MSDVSLSNAEMMFPYTTCKQSLGGDICFTQSIRLFVCPLSVDMILSTHVLRNWCMDIPENLYTNYSLSEDVHLEMFLYFKTFFCLTLKNY